MSTDTPAQWRMVPVEPTVAMQSEGARALYHDSGDEIDATYGEVAAAYRAMIAASPQPAQEPVAWMESPHGAIRANPLYRWTAPKSLAWSIPLYAATTQPTAAPVAELVEALPPLTDKEIDKLIYTQCPEFDHWHEGPSIDDLHAIIRAALSRAPGAGMLNVEFSGVPAGHSSNHPAGGTSAGTQG